MVVIGRIEAISGGINFDCWAALIESLPSLKRPAARMGLNPFTRKPVAYKEHPLTAEILTSAGSVGGIFAALDGSPLLIVDADEGSQEEVAKFAIEIAARLDARFVREVLPD